MARNFTRSRSGTEASLASSKTRRLNSNQERSRSINKRSSSCINDRLKRHNLQMLRPIWELLKTLRKHNAIAMPIISIYTSGLLGVVSIPDETEDHFICSRSETDETLLLILTEHRRDNLGPFQRKN